MDVNVVSLACTSCGAPVQVAPDVDQVACQYCATTLVVQRGDGGVSLRMAREITRAVSESGRQTQAEITRSAQAAQVELRRLNVSQRIAALQAQLSGVQAEIRSLERQKVNKTGKKQLKALRSQEQQLIHGIRVCNHELETVAGYSGVQGGAARVAAKPKSPLRKACISGCLVYVVIAALVSSIGISIDIAAIFSAIIGCLVFVVMAFPDATLWSPITKRLSRKGRQAHTNTQAGQNQITSGQAATGRESNLPTKTG